MARSRANVLPKVIGRLLAASAVRPSLNDLICSHEKCLRDGDPGPSRFSYQSTSRARTNLRKGQPERADDRAGIRPHDRRNGREQLQYGQADRSSHVALFRGEQLSLLASFNLARQSTTRRFVMRSNEKVLGNVLSAAETAAPFLSCIKSLMKSCAVSMNRFADNWAAATMYDSLRSLSDAELRKRGLSRATLAHSSPRPPSARSTGRLARRT